LPNHPVAGKTGTTNSMRDAWFIGFTADYVAGVWMGYDDNTPLSGVTGGGLPAELWRQTMERIHRDISPRPLPMIDPASRGAPDPPVIVEYGPATARGKPCLPNGRRANRPRAARCLALPRKMTPTRSSCGC
jgi:penicillin-binding protein 1A